MSAADRRTVGEILAELDRLIGERYDWMDGEMPDARGFPRDYRPTPREAALWDALWDLLGQPGVGPLPYRDCGARDYAYGVLTVECEHWSVGLAGGGLGLGGRRDWRTRL
jgi:hypothetical protein